MPNLRNTRRLPAALAGIAAFLLPGAARAADKLDSGDTAWMLTATALVLLMTIPGLALFYGGMVRKKNVLSVLMQVFAVCCIASVVWVVVGYSIAFGGDGPYIGGFSQLFLAGIAPDSMSGSIPESVFAMFQMTFAIITPALIVGAFVDRMKFSAMLLFTVIWLIVVYAPICHWVWGSGGWIGGLGALDFAGGTVVHINSGVAALVAAIVVGKRLNYGRENMAPHNLTLSVIGASLLWVGWFGFNAGSALTAGTGAGFAMLVTQLATAVAALAWTFAEWAQRGKPSVLGIVSGAIAGLVAITPASGFVGVLGAIVIGLAAGLVCYWASTSLKHKLGYDDSLDVFGIHGVGGIVGALLTGVFATRFVTGGENAVGWIDGNFAQILPQIYGIAATIVWTGVLTFVILVLVRAVTGLRVSEEIERGSLDLELHGETVQ
ncbi:MAG: ammonium transporter [Rhodospirillaceae bacterium]|nr:ammonium transporter [Rhodospirillaceae bacterium]MYB13753.1 ammonium transporter [Rhodospirillaceae bacterium]MYI47759.1 ammonium transporter [Rhodospirillaceae bacterium]